MIEYEPGRYSATITDHGLGMTQTGKPQIIVRFRVESFANGEPCATRERTAYRVVTDNTKEYVTKDLEAIGFSGTVPSQLSRDSANAVDLTGNRIEVDCKHDTYQGDTNEKWSIAWTGGGALTERPLDAAEKRKLDAMFGKCVPTNASKPTAQRSSAPPPAADDPRDDEIPF